MEHFDRLTFDLPTESWPLVGQQANLVMILENLISNAIKYQDLTNPIPKVTVGLAQNQGYCTISVTDNGLGIPESNRENVFAMFRRFHPETSFGSGLGLYMIKKAAERLRGTVEYRPEEPGSTFLVTFPTGK
jgi:signal transduction histidine kinase